MYGEQPMPTGTVVAVAQAPQAVAIAEPIAAEPVAVAAVAPSPNGQAIATADWNGLTKIWC